MNDHDHNVVSGIRFACMKESLLSGAFSAVGGSSACMMAVRWGTVGNRHIFITRKNT